MVTKKGRKVSGGKYIKNRKKKANEIGGQRRIIKLGKEKRRSKRVKGGRYKSFLLRANMINLLIDGEIKKISIKNVLETPSNKFLARQNILTKGTIVETELGKAKITNRPSQDGIANGILIG